MYHDAPLFPATLISPLPEKNLSSQKRALSAIVTNLAPDANQKVRSIFREEFKE